MSPNIPKFKLFDNIRVMQTSFAKEQNIDNKTGTIKEILGGDDYVVQLEDMSTPIKLNGCYMVHNYKPPKS